jgi:hypothetical protein
MVKLELIEDARQIKLMPVRDPDRVLSPGDLYELSTNLEPDSPQDSLW